MNPLSPKKRSELRSEAHKLGPLVIIGDKGLTDEVVTEIDRTLKAHELIKVRATTDDRKARDEWLGVICERLQAHPVQQIGKVFVLYRENPVEKPVKPPRAPRAPREEEAPKVKPKGERRIPRARDAVARKGRSTATGTSPPRSRTPSPRPASGPRRRPRSTSR